VFFVICEKSVRRVVLINFKNITFSTKKHIIPIIYIYKRLRLRPSKKIRNRKKERATETLNLKLITKPLKFKCGLADKGGGGGAGRPMQGMGTPT
jgi:hypothetical protein